MGMFWWSEVLYARCCVLFADKLVMEGKSLEQGEPLLTEHSFAFFTQKKRISMQNAHDINMKDI